ncbi:MAG: plasmid mobilization relaxosome protein MobC [Eubacteriales bacterium]
MDKSQRITFRLTDHEKRSIEYRAKRAKMSVGEYCRETVSKSEIFVVEGLEQLLPELNKIGSNCNQMAWQMNSHRVENPDLESMRKSLNLVLEKVYDILSGGEKDSHSQANHQADQPPF